MNVLFLYAHLDDETILSYGTILKFIDLGYTINVYICCNNGRSNVDVAKRLNTFINGLQFKNVNIKTFQNNDLSLTKDKIKNILNNIDIDPDIVITHSIHDLHFEHRLIAEEAMIKYRPMPTNNIKRLLTTTSLTYIQTHNKFGVFNPNVFIDISEYADKKLQHLLEYDMELPNDLNDLRSADSTMLYNKYYGKYIGSKYAEPYEQIFERI